MDRAEVTELADRIRRRWAFRSLIFLLAVVVAAFLARNGSDYGRLIAGFLVFYVIVTGTWAYVAASRILEEFCVNSAEEISRLKNEVEELRALVKTGHDRT